MKTRIAFLLLLLLLSPWWLGAGCTATVPREGVVTDPYRVGNGDVVHVEVYKEPDISRSYEVSSDGTINHPLLGRVEVAGLTVSQVEERLRELLARDYLVDPRVDVTLAQTSNRPIMLFGEVRGPGAYDMPVGRSVTLLQVIARAGGFTDTAARDRVRIVRVENGRERTIKVRVTDLLRGRDGVKDVELQAGDVVTVPETIF